MKWVLMLMFVFLAGCVTKRTVWVYADDLAAIRKRVTDAEVVQYGFTPGDPDTLTIRIPKHQRKIITKADSPVEIKYIVIDMTTGRLLNRGTEEFVLH
jgi:hypothetical protein